LDEAMAAIKQTMWVSERERESPPMVQITGREPLRIYTSSLIVGLRVKDEWERFLTEADRSIYFEGQRKPL